MFTVKVVQGGDTFITSSSAVHVARKGSLSFRIPLEAMAAKGCEAADWVLLDAFSEVDSDVMPFVCIDRLDQKPDNAIAAIVYPDGLTFPEGGVPFSCLAAYRMVYKGDVVYIMAENGKTVEVVQ